VDSENVRTRNG